MIKRFRIIFILLNFLPFHSYGLTILLDPGHGGEDHGAIYKYSNGNKISEKDLTLSICKKIQKYLGDKYSVYLTRSIDRTIDLDKRAEMADMINADLVLSVHINSDTKHSSKGFETFYLDNRNGAALKKIEEVENKNLTPKDLVVNSIVNDLLIKKNLPESKKMAKFLHRKIQKFIGRPYKMVDRGIKSGLFYVLALTKRPAVLLEVGFISNKNELSKMMSLKFQNQYAKAISDGIVEYSKERSNQVLAIN